MQVTTTAAFGGPLSLGPAVWLRGDSLTLDGSNNVSSWTDKSGNGNHAVQGTAINRPTGTTATIGSQVAVGFTAASSQSLVIPYAAALQTATVTMFAVWRWNTAAHGATFTALVTHTSSSGWTDGYGLLNGPAGTDGQFEFFVTLYSSDFAGSTYANTTPRCTIGVYDKTNVRLLVDGASVGSPVALASDISYNNNCQTVIGGFTNAGGTGVVAGFVSADIAEVAIYGRALAAGELSSLHTYAAARYGTP